MHPTSILWWDGKTYPIEPVGKPCRKSARWVGGDGICYRIRLGNYETDLYYENPRWFVEEKVYDEGL